MEYLFCAQLGSVAKSMVQDDVALTLVFVVMEKLMETEFICPCDASNLHHDTLVICSSLIIHCLLVHMKCSLYKKLKDSIDNTCFCLSHTMLSMLLFVLLWLFVLSYDGQYYVCQKTNWNGTWTENPANVLSKWCKPSANDTNVNDLQRMSSECFFQSQVWFYTYT